MIRAQLIITTEDGVIIRNKKLKELPRHGSSIVYLGQVLEVNGSEACDGLSNTHRIWCWLDGPWRLVLCAGDTP